MFQSNPITQRNQLGRSSTSIARRRWLHHGALACVVVWLALSPRAHAVCQQGCDSSGNTFLGDDALLNNVYGANNSAFGAYALYTNSGAYGGNDNTATGAYALYHNTGISDSGLLGSCNIATGAYALFNNLNGYANTASGYMALYQNTSGMANTANGNFALSHNTTANNNTADGSNALASNTSGYQNTASGVSALYKNITGSRNVAVGANALSVGGFANFNTAIGFQALYQTSGSNNTALGFNAGSNLTTGSGNVCIGYNVVGVARESNTTRISNIYSSVASGRPVYIDADNKIGTLVSSRRFKEDIRPMDKASKAILALKPVTFRYKKEIEPNSGIMYGLIAEDVEKIDPNLVTHDKTGDPETVRYEAVNAMLLNEFLKEHSKVEEQDRHIAKQENEIRSLAAQLQKVNSEIKLMKASPQVVINR